MSATTCNNGHPMAAEHAFCPRCGSPPKAPVAAESPPLLNPPQGPGWCQAGDGQRYRYPSETIPAASGPALNPAQGPAWWQASDGKWYPPATNATFPSSNTARSTGAGKVVAVIGTGVAIYGAIGWHTATTAYHAYCTGLLGALQSATGQAGCATELHRTDVFMAVCFVGVTTVAWSLVTLFRQRS
jgi:hypothetical protein